MKIKLIKIDDTELVVPLTLKVPKRLYKRLDELVEATKVKQDKEREKAKKKRKDPTAVGQPSKLPRMASKQTILLSIIEQALKDPSFEIEIETI